MVGVVLVGLLRCLYKIYFTVDFKVLIAYSSVVHMSILVLGYLIELGYGVYGCLLVVVFHSFISIGLFYLVGHLSEVYHSRSFFILKNTLLWGCWFMVLVFVSLVLNFGFPIRGSFLGEVRLVYRIVFFDKIFVIFVIFIIVVSLLVNVEVVLVIVFRGASIQEKYSSVLLTVGMFLSLAFTSLGVVLLLFQLSAIVVCFGNWYE